MDSIFEKYTRTLTKIIGSQTWDKTELLAQAMLATWQDRRQFFLCGNGGSAGNAIHLANDFLYGVASKLPYAGMRVEALPANTAVISCLAKILFVRYAASHSDLLSQLGVKYIFQPRCGVVIRKLLRFSSHAANVRRDDDLTACTGIMK